MPKMHCNRGISQPKTQKGDATHARQKETMSHISLAVLQPPGSDCEAVWALQCWHQAVFPVNMANVQVIDLNQTDAVSA